MCAELAISGFSLQSIGVIYRQLSQHDFDKRKKTLKYDNSQASSGLKTSLFALSCHIRDKRAIISPPSLIFMSIGLLFLSVTESYIKFKCLRSSLGLSETDT